MKEDPRDYMALPLTFKVSAAQKIKRLTEFGPLCHIRLLTLSHSLNNTEPEKVGLLNRRIVLPQGNLSR
jgi:hypothetical protein